MGMGFFSLMFGYSLLGVDARCWREDWRWAVCAQKENVFRARAGGEDEGGRIGTKICCRICFGRDVARDL